MGQLQLSTAGESHGPAEIAILSGMPAGLEVQRSQIDEQLARRQRGYGRGGRQRIESDEVKILSGVRRGRTSGAPIALLVENRDHSNWLATMSPDSAQEDDPNPVTVPRPGHADLAGVAKFAFPDARDVLERSSARATVARVAAGALARLLLSSIGAEVRGRVLSVGPVIDKYEVDYLDPRSIDWSAVDSRAEATAGEEAAAAVRGAVDRAREQGVSLGGTFEVWTWGLPPGLGGYARAEDRLDGRLAGAVMAIPAIKGVEVGLGFAAGARPGTQVHDVITTGEAGHGRSAGSLTRLSNNAGGLEGGMTNGMPVIIRAVMKPIPTMATPLGSIDLATGARAEAHRERADVEAVPAARVVAEAEVALVLASACLEKFGGDTLGDFQEAFSRYRERVEGRGLWPSP